MFGGGGRREKDMRQMEGEREVEVTGRNGGKSEKRGGPSEREKSQWGRQKDTYL